MITDPFTSPNAVIDFACGHDDMQVILTFWENKF